MVDREGHFIAVGGVCPLRRDQPGVVDQHVDPAALGEQRAGQSAHRIEAGEIGEGDARQIAAGAFCDRPARGLSAGPVASDHDDPHPDAREPDRGVKADPGARPCNNGDWGGQ